ncbi:hypothetical protein NDU88_007354 [Pleurodeles waltl]|uniref:Uncharacterized protein n=1 Tax=Pleurodeles waltl TaxID=8319 RepID=A0AAV7RTW3_PLEWA|nr:hypothetical protein NDU88_007354 [Pleurodeles waltl]
MLQEEGREDLLNESTLVVEGEGLKRPRRASSEGVAAAVIACSPPVSGKKYKQKSVMGRKYAQAAVLDMEAEVGQGQDLPMGSRSRHTRGSCIEEVQAVEGIGRGRASGVFRAGSEFIAPGCGGSLASSGQEEQFVKAGQGRPAFIAGHTVGVSTPLRHRQEERVRPGAAHPTSGVPLGSSQVRDGCTIDEPSTSQGAIHLNWDVGFDETLDFEDVDERDLGGADFVEVSGQGNNQSRSYNVLQGQKRLAVRSDRRDADRITSGSAGNLPGGEERGIMGDQGRVGVGGERSKGTRVRVQDMGIQTVNDNNVEKSKVDVSKVSVSGNDKGETVSVTRDQACLNGDLCHEDIQRYKTAFATGQDWTGVVCMAAALEPRP